jgi:hypothetical protein
VQHMHVQSINKISAEINGEYEGNFHTEYHTIIFDSHFKPSKYMSVLKIYSPNMF